MLTQWSTNYRQILCFWLLSFEFQFCCYASDSNFIFILLDSIRSSQLICAQSFTKSSSFGTMQTGVSIFIGWLYDFECFFLCFILHLNIFLYFYFSLLSYNEHFEHMSPPSTLCHSETCVFLNSSKSTATKCWAKVTLLETSIYYNANQELLDIKYHHSKMLWVFSEMNYYFNLEPLIKSLNYSQSDYEAFIRFSQNL